METIERGDPEDDQRRHDGRIQSRVGARLEMDPTTARGGWGRSHPSCNRWRSLTMWCRQSLTDHLWGFIRALKLLGYRIHLSLNSRPIGQAKRSGKTYFEVNVRLRRKKCSAKISRRTACNTGLLRAPLYQMKIMAWDLVNVERDRLKGMTESSRGYQITH